MRNPADYTGNPAATGAGIELLHQFLASHPRQPGKSTATQIREAAAGGNELARRLLQTGVLALGMETKADAAS